MRVLDTETLKVRYKKVQEIYAILSHVWGEEEVTFQNIQDLDYAQRMAGFTKLAGAASLAKSQGYACIWIDTCCIDKTSSAELSEAINSMYEWYKESDVCYAYLVDLEIGHVAQGSATNAYFETSLRSSRWFRRGWTLQELIAPSSVEFYAKGWTFAGTRDTLQGLISAITGIDIYMLQKGDPHNVSIARRMSWASGRQTTRKEDAAYCLMGLFGVNMPLLYGEGHKAFIRLQEEIMKVSDDQSLFVWNRSIYYTGHTYNRYNSLLAMSPAEFRLTGRCVPLLSAQRFSPAASIMSNRGIQIKLAIISIRLRKQEEFQAEPTHLGILSSSFGSSPGTFAAIRLVQLGDPSTFRRVGRDIDTVRVARPPAQVFSKNDTRNTFVIKWHHQTQHDIVDSKTLPPSATFDWTEAKTFREVTIVSNDHTETRLPPPISVLIGDRLQLLSAWPKGSWDPSTSTMFWPLHPHRGLMQFSECAFLLQYQPDNSFRCELFGLCLELRCSVYYGNAFSEIHCNSMKFFKVRELQSHEERMNDHVTKPMQRLVEMMRAWKNDTTLNCTVERLSQDSPFKVSLQGFRAHGQTRVILNIVNIGQSAEKRVAAKSA